MKQHDENICGFPRCSHRSCVWLINVPLCDFHWQQRCQVEGTESEPDFLAKIGLRKNEQGETVTT